MPLMISWPTDIDSISRPQLDHPIHNDKHQQQQMLALVSAPTFSIFTLHFWHPFLFCKFNWYVPPCHCEYLSPRTQLVSDSLIAWSAIINSSSCFPHPFSRFHFFVCLFYAINSILCPTAPLCCPPQAEAVTRSTGKNSPFFFFTLHCFGYFLFFKSNCYIPIQAAVDYSVHRHNLHVLTQCLIHHKQQKQWLQVQGEKPAPSPFLYFSFAVIIFHFNHYATICCTEEISAHIHMCWFECLVHSDKQK
jgi:hypothetical protein